jgi:hypothetical protein
MHCPPTQFMPPAQGRLQPPQWALLVLVSAHIVPHNIWLAPAQPQVPLTQAVAPAGQALQPPQCAIVPSPLDGMHAPPEHMIWPDGHIAEQALALHTWPLWHTVQLGPQWVASEATHCPLQFIRPDEHWQVPFWHIRPVPHALPQLPQFALSVATVLHWPLQSIWPAAQLLLAGGLLGVAQLEASSRQPKAAVRRAAERGARVFIDLPRR